MAPVPYKLGRILAHAQYLYIYYFFHTLFHIVDFFFLAKEENERIPCGMRENNIRNKLSSHITAAYPGIEPGSQWWNADALTAQPLTNQYVVVVVVVVKTLFNKSIIQIQFTLARYKYNSRYSLYENLIVNS